MSALLIEKSSGISLIAFVFQRENSDVSLATVIMISFLLKDSSDSCVTVLFPMIRRITNKIMPLTERNFRILNTFYC
jgi:hypothetical protein